MRRIKRGFALLLSVILLFSLFPAMLSSANATAADDQEAELLGTISRYFETGSTEGDPGRIATVDGDAGGKSYGAYMFASNAGSPKLFFKWCQSSGNSTFVAFGNELANAYSQDGNSYGSNFDSTWKYLANLNSSGFMQAQSQYIKAQYYTPLVTKVEADVPGFYISNYSIALRNVFLSRAVQHGVSGAYNVITRAFTALGGFCNQSESVLIDAIYAESGAVGTTKANTMTGASALKYGVSGKTLKYYSGCSGDIQLGVYYRLNIKEPAMVHQMLADYGYTDVSVSQGTYQLLSGSNTNLAAVANSANSVVLNASSSNANQYFALVYYASGYYCLTNTSNGYRLSVVGGAVKVSAPSTSNAQFWTIVPYKNGYALQNRETGTYLTSGGSAGSTVTLSSTPTVWQVYGGGWELSGLSCPVSLVEGSSNYNFWGTLTCSSAITNVSVEIVRADGTVYSTASASPDSTVYNLHKLDSNVPFSKLSSGSYTLRVKATNANGGTFEQSKNFYVINSCTVTLNANGGSCSAATVSAALGSVYGTLPTPVFSGHQFLGWYTAADGGTQVTSTSSVPMQTTQTLYAHWTNLLTYTFYNADGTVFYSGQCVSGATIPTPSTNPTKADSATSYFTFSGWSGYTSGMTMGGSNIAFTPQFTEHSISEVQQIQTSTYTISNGYLSKIPAGTTAATMLSQLTPSTKISITKNGVTAQGAISTGCVVSSIYNGTVVQSLTTVVTGDVNGDGTIDITDLVQINFSLLGKITLSEASAQAADLDGDGSVTINDLVQVNFYLLGRSQITPR